MANNAKMTNLQALLSAGINPKNGLPYRNEGEEKVMLKDNIRRCLRVLDEQTAINRFVLRSERFFRSKRLNIPLKQKAT